MSDATLPPLRSSSTAPSGEDENRSDSNHGEAEPNTPLIHSMDTLGRGHGSSGSEGKTDGKQKRKRTSPEDQAVLEAEYKENPKPNKASRATIVEKVNMNEKEVQIWFQNRRQISRRKSRPLLPHEIAAFGVVGIVALSDPATALAVSSSPDEGDVVISSEQDGILCGQQKDIASSQWSPVPDDPEHKETCMEPVVEEPVGLAARSPPTEPPAISSIVESLESQSSFDVVSTETSSLSITESVIKSFSSTPGYLANRWNSASSFSSTPSSSQNAASFKTPSSSYPVLPSSCPERIGGSQGSIWSPGVRLSMSIDGKAELVETLSSPPRPSSSGAAMPRQRRGLQRSQSVRQPTRKSSIGKFIPRLTSGRSRDARAWEFCCDPEAQDELPQDELTTHATNESTGSAIAAISLLRSTSNSALKPNNNKRNAPATKQDTSTHGKKLKLGRAMSSLARLQSTETPSFKPSKPTTSKGSLMGSPSGDSDKENWLPGDETRRRPLPVVRGKTQSQPKAVLGDNHKIVSHANLGGARNNKRGKGAAVAPEIFEDEENKEPGDEIEKFMRGGEVSPSKKGDYNAIQGLLSLSQGNWR